MLLQKRKRLRFVQKRQQSRRRDERRGLDCLRRHSIFEIERENGRVALDQLKDVGALVPADVEVRRRLARERPHRNERRTFRVRELELSWRLAVSGHAHGINRCDWAGKADGRHAVRRHGHGDDGALVERDALDGFGRFSERDGCGQQENVGIGKPTGTLTRLLYRLTCKPNSRMWIGNLFLATGRILLGQMTNVFCLPVVTGKIHGFSIQ